MSAGTSPSLLPLTLNATVVLVERRFVLPRMTQALRRGCWRLVAGMIERRRNREAVARREAMEEAGADGPHPTGHRLRRVGRNKTALIYSAISG
ncbi:NUDIX domain-containing protein [Salmonella enterica subsp. enterica]|nr:NUDIX domain-containing protein [Salmonella enterica subsp. enterica]